MNDKEHIQLDSLAIDGNPNRIGADPSEFSFSWKLVSDKRGVKQKSFQLSLFPLHADGTREPELWNSGVTRSRMTFHRYLGPRLQPHRAYGWKLLVWETGASDPVEAESRFVTGLAAEDWSAEWIWDGGSLSRNQFVYFRKEYLLEQQAESAYVSISAHHYFQLYVNGERAGGYVSPAPSDPAKGKLYVTYDIAPLLKPDGRNCLAVIALYTGDGGQNNVDGLPGLIVQAELQLQDGSRRRWATGTDWQHLSSGAHQSGAAFQQNRKITPIESVDARLLPSSWMEYNFHHKGLKPASLSLAPDTSWQLTPQLIPEGIIDEEIQPKLVFSQPTEDGICHIYDAGRIVSGWVRLLAPGVRDVQVRARYAEQLGEDGLVERKVANECSERYYDEYTMRGDALEEWQPAFTYKAFRFIEVTGYPDTLQQGQLTVIAARTGLKELGSFRSSDDFLNKLFSASIKTQKNNILGQVVDCPHREQAQYLADSDLQAELLLYHFGSAVGMLDKTLTDFQNAQDTDGAFPFVAPCNAGNPDFSIRIPEWDLHFISLLWKLYEASGDESLLRKHYWTAKRTANRWLAMRGDNGLVPKSEWWHISDWPYPVVDDSGSALTVQNTKLYQGVRDLERIAALIGLGKESRQWKSDADALSAAIADSLFDIETNGFMDSYGSPARHQGVNALAVLAGLAPPSADRKKLLRRIATEAWEARTVLSLPLLKLLFQEGMGDEAYSYIHRTEYPGWGYMIAQGSPTLWEGWDDRESHSHAWNGYPVRLLSEYVAGIQAGAPGFTTIRFRPFCPNGLQQIEASVPTPFGITSAGWIRNEDGLELMLQVPAGAEGELWLTAETLGRPLEELRIDESGSPIWQQNRLLPSAKSREVCGDRLPEAIRLQFESGTYRFRIA
ncbi:glycoside hydrolase family 78 protein [Paenibacillus pasadenensis]|uniref:family 78 glycoside hydrolase catalytic domain n=1 Tax=Paenibacillus pasadenensis TaxID=217090 RepID=UPI0020412E1D|nr:family 78 glycoside hydrolase catalytic domain [Paenibacillus pasadenensis]MCM3747026.1 glycoside hydrolase family 78 protein [Paenibacillus pasadenensis]